MSEEGLDVLGTSVNDKNGAVSAQLGDAVSQEAVAEDAEWFQHVGFASRPARATPGKSSCQVLSLERTGRDVCYASRDLRKAPPYGALGEGETCLYANGPNGTGTATAELRDDGTDASVVLSVRQGNASNGGAVRVELSSDGKVTITAGSASVVVDASGSISVHAPSVSLGGTGGAPVVVDSGALLTWITTVATGLNGLGVANTPPVSITATSVTAK